MNGNLRWWKKCVWGQQGLAPFPGAGTGRSWAWSHSHGGWDLLAVLQGRLNGAGGSRWGWGGPSRPIWALTKALHLLVTTDSRSGSALLRCSCSSRFVLRHPKLKMYVFQSLKYWPIVKLFATLFFCPWIIPRSYFFSVLLLPIHLQLFLLSCVTTCFF